jgi:hypothetical protein
MFLYHDLTMIFIGGRNYLPANKHSLKSELCLTETFVVHLSVKATRMFHITVTNVSNLLRMGAEGDKCGKYV